MCSVDGPDLLGAVRSTIRRVEAIGLGHVQRVQMDPEPFGDAA